MGPFNLPLTAIYSNLSSLSIFMTKIEYVLLICSVRATCPAHYIHLDMINQGVPVINKLTQHTDLQ